MTISHSPLLPQHTFGTTPIPAAARPLERETDRYHIGHVLAGLMALPPDSAGAQTDCLDHRLEEEQQPVQSDEEVIRLLIPAESVQLDVDVWNADAWNIVTLTRPRGGGESDWQVFAAYGPMRLDKASEFLARLGGKVIGVEKQSDYPILDSLDLPPAEAMVSAADGSPLPRATALVVQLTSEYGPEYTGLLARAVSDASHGNQESYMAGLNAAIDVMAGVAGDRPKCKALAISHVGVFLTELRADTRSASHGGTVPRNSPPAGGLSREARS
ncbi:hypothetical protein [Nocardia alni]|uniref:hypothetical protein n=1 Tax=Nocardia alni TaxID=2815723 RepID=UPI001C23647B|nr:hypothetical protein [Nocardia alni]